MKLSGKRIISMLCCATFILGMSSPAMAMPDEAHMQKVLEKDKTYEGFLQNDDMLTYEEILQLSGATVQNEIEILYDLQSKPISELREMDITEDEIQMLKTKSVKEVVLDKLRELPVQELQDRGLSNVMIDNIKKGNYDLVDEKDVERASSKLAFAIASPSRSGTNCNYSVYWHWDREPVATFEDTIVAGISDGYNVAGSKCTAKLTYKDRAHKLSDTTDRIPASWVTRSICRFDIPMIQDNSDINIIRYCQAGKAFVSTYGSVSPNWDLQASAEYIHSYVPEGFNLTIGLNAGIINVGISGSAKSEGNSIYYIHK